jgi:restriction system protein
MPIPDYQTVMLPLLRFVSDGKDHSLRETIDFLADHFFLTAEERQELLPSGSQAIFDNRVGWAKTHILRAGLLESPRRSIFRITERGKDVIKSESTTNQRSIS